MIQFSSTYKENQQATLVFLTTQQVVEQKEKLLAPTIKSLLIEIINAKLFEGKKGEVFPSLIKEKLIVFIGLGKKEEVTPIDLRIAARRAVMNPYLKKVSQCQIIPHQDTKDVISAVIEGIVIGSYVWKKYISKKKEDVVIEKKFCILADEKAEYKIVETIAKNTNWARDLINDNADIVHALYLEKAFKSIVKGQKNIDVEILGRKELEKKKFGLLLAVNQGSNKEPRVLIARYQGGKKNEPWTAFVGKGLTFDSGGLNLKPSGSMESMREDMSGAAAVLATLKNAVELNIKKNIIFACGIAENAIDANAYKPGDVIVGHAGISVEVGNTDAEGRLVLADVLSYIHQKDKPSKVIDIATLTGAVVVALAHEHTGLVSNDDEMADAMLKIAQQTTDRAWRLPLYPELKDAIKSKIADIRNTSNWRGAGGTITGAEFLRRFIGHTPWVHLDIAGTAFVEGDSHLYYGHGATGSGVRLVTHYFLSN